LTKEQINNLSEVFQAGVPSIVSVFAGRIADTGEEATEYVRYAIEAFQDKKDVEILWASTREIYNIVQAINIGTHIITVPNDLLPKLTGLGKNLSDLSQETVQQFRQDAIASGYSI